MYGLLEGLVGLQCCFQFPSCPRTFLLCWNRFLCLVSLMWSLNGQLGINQMKNSSDGRSLSNRCTMTLSMVAQIDKSMSSKLCRLLYTHGVMLCSLAHVVVGKMDWVPNHCDVVDFEGSQSFLHTGGSGTYTPENCKFSWVFHLFKSVWMIAALLSAFMEVQFPQSSAFGYGLISWICISSWLCTNLLKRLCISTRVTFCSKRTCHGLPFLQAARCSSWSMIRRFVKSHLKQEPRSDICFRPNVSFNKKHMATTYSQKVWLSQNMHSLPQTCTRLIGFLTFLNQAPSLSRSPYVTLGIVWNSLLQQAWPFPRFCTGMAFLNGQRSWILMVIRLRPRHPSLRAKLLWSSTTQR